MRANTVRTRILLGVGVAAIAAVVATAAFGASGGGKITTIAGTENVGGAGGWKFSGDGGPATGANLAGPHDVAVDARRNVYILDWRNNRVRKVSAGGTITTIAGTGYNHGYSGDGGPAALAELAGPRGMTIDAQGNLYFTDSGYPRVRKISANGTFTTVAGNGRSGFSGDGGPATSAELANPRDVAVDAQGNLYIVDGNNNRVRKVSPGGIITTFAGTGTAGFSGDGGPATSAQLYGPEGVAVDARGNVYIADRNNRRVRKVTRGGTITTLVGSGKPGITRNGTKATSALLFQPWGIAVDARGTVYFSDQGGGRVYKVSGGRVTTFAGSRDGGFAGDGGPATLALLASPFGIAFDRKGNLYIADFLNNRVRKVTVTR